MKIKTATIRAFTIPALLYALWSNVTTTAYAQITNPAIPGQWGGANGATARDAESGYLFSLYFLRTWNALSAVGALLVIGYFIWAAFDWLTSAGEKGKLESARNKMIQSVIGLIILVSLYTIIGVISDIFFGTEFNILSPTFITNFTP
jgi:hypothetical protein